MKYMIHSCNKRLWYVKRYLIPSMLDQGISLEDIILWNDYFSVGNQKSWYNSCKYIKLCEPLNEGMWHLTDDVMISHQFYTRTKSVPNNLNIRCGFVTNKFNPRNKTFTGAQPLSKCWRSFPCIYIPNKYVAEFVDWYDKVVVQEHQFQKEYEGGNDDDTLFLACVTQLHPAIRSVNLKPCLVDHIDYLIGGSVLFDRKQKIHRACYLSDIDKKLVEELTKQLKGK